MFSFCHAVVTANCGKKNQVQNLSPLLCSHPTLGFLLRASNGIRHVAHAEANCSTGCFYAGPSIQAETILCHIFYTETLHSSL